MALVSGVGGFSGFRAWARKSVSWSCKCQLALHVWHVFAAPEIRSQDCQRS